MENNLPNVEDLPDATHWYEKNLFIHPQTSPSTQIFHIPTAT